MKLQFLRFETEIALSGDAVSTLQVEDRLLFSRMVQSLVSEQGEQACEPYRLWDDTDKKVNPRKALLVIDSLPGLPLDDRGMLGKLYAQIENSINDEVEFEGDLANASARLQQLFRALNAEMWGRYEFGVDWSPALFLKSFGFQPMQEEGDALLENCIRFFELCVDIGFDKPLVIVNAKSFFAQNDLEELFSQAIFHGIALMVMESWQDSRILKNEQKIVIDQHFVESTVAQDQLDDHLLQQDFAPSALEQRHSDW